MAIEHINPKGLFHMEGFTQVVAATGARTIYIAGQGAFDKEFKLIWSPKQENEYSVSVITDKGGKFFGQGR